MDLSGASLLQKHLQFNNLFRYSRRPETCPHLYNFYMLVKNISSFRPALRTPPVVPFFRGSRFAMSPRHGTHQQSNENDAVQFDIITDDRPYISAYEEQNTRVWNKIGKNAPSKALAALTLLGLPAVSNAMSISMAGAYSTWFASLTDSGFYQAFSLVFLSEIGDKTFFVAALLAAKLSRVISFVGSLGALAVMTVISVIIGQVFHAVPTELANGVPLDDVAAVIAFTYFGVKILSEAFETDEEGKSAMDEEFEEAEETVKGSDTITKASAG